MGNEDFGLESVAQILDRWDREQKTATDGPPEMPNASDRSPQDESEGLRTPYAPDRPPPNVPVPISGSDTTLSIMGADGVYRKLADITDCKGLPFQIVTEPAPGRYPTAESAAEFHKTGKLSFELGECSLDRICRMFRIPKWLVYPDPTMTPGKFRYLRRYFNRGNSGKGRNSTRRAKSNRTVLVREVLESGAAGRHTRSSNDRAEHTAQSRKAALDEPGPCGGDPAIYGSKIPHE